MQALIDSGRVLDWLLALIALEALLLAGWLAAGRARARGIGVGVAFADLMPNLFAGAFLIAAARSLSMQAQWQWTAAWLALAGLAHAMDLRRRIERRRPVGPGRRINPA